MKYEIGSEFEFNYELIMSNEPKDLDDVFKTSEYKLISSGRCGIKQVLLNLIKLNDEKDEFLLPSYLCPSIVQPFNELNLKIVYYNVNPDLTIDLDDVKSKLNKKTKAAYFINYFGVSQPTEVISFLSSLKERKICLIEDITHNFFSKREDIGDYLICSLRKWGPLPHGGLVIKNKNTWEYDDFYERSNLALEIGQLRAFGQQLKYLYVNGLKSEQVKNTYLPILQKMDHALYSHIEIVPMDELSVNMLQRMDFENLTKKRRENYKYLYENLKAIKELTILIGDIKDVV
ncbi:MAG: aminotransferase class V-fold PLP-dependent enzyme, partial [Bacillota bacterium]|nr:aminotransferase class V-fold PLP-dependent enzyme [Bacillota bacterium]